MAQIGMSRDRAGDWKFRESGKWEAAREEGNRMPRKLREMAKWAGLMNFGGSKGEEQRPQEGKLETSAEQEGYPGGIWAGQYWRRSSELNGKFENSQKVSLEEDRLAE